MLLQLTLVFGNHSRADRLRLLKVHSQTGAAADREVNGTGSLWRVWASKQRGQLTIKTATKQEESALIHILYRGCQSKSIKGRVALGFGFNHATAHRTELI